MKKSIALIIIAALFCAILAGCGATNYTINFDCVIKTAKIRFPNGEEKTIQVDKFSDYTYNDHVRIVSTDGTVYLTAWQNVVLIGEVINDD